MVRQDEPSPAARSGGAYLDFWDGVGEHFPLLKGAPSTAYYFECERLLHEQFFPDLRGRRLLKTDLWDEAKNTEILRWAAEQGARPLGIDISLPTVRQAAAVLAAHRPWVLLGDVRAIPLQADSVDLIYSMGTIEHFPEYRAALAEIFRVLRPGGRAIVGVPNRWDPFLRPLLVAAWNLVGRYPYGMEKAFAPGELRRLLAEAGFRPVALSGILFMPGWLRMVDLWLHARSSRLTRLTGWLVRPFAWLYRRVPAVRRHGYLIAWVVDKPDGAAHER